MKKKFLVLLFALSLFVPVARAATFTLGATSLIEGSGAGSDSVSLLAGISWTATTNATWLHLSAGYQSGLGSTNVIFSFDANTGATRIGTLTIAGQTLTITQAGSTYSNVTSVSTLVSSGLSNPEGIALDAAGNVYIADFGNKMVKKWTATNNTVTTLISTGLGGPAGLALDVSGNIYIGDGTSNVVRKWTAANSNLTTLVSTGLNNPSGVAVDSAGNVYIADTGNNAIKKWAVSGGAVSTLVSSGLNAPTGVALDAAANVYIVDFLNSAIKKWTAVNSNVTLIVSSGLNGPEGLAVDGEGNVYIADTLNNAVKVWTAASNTVTTLISSGLTQPLALAADNAGNVYFSDYGHNQVKKRLRAMVDTTALSELPSAGSGTLPVVLPSTQDLLAPFAPTSDSAWLTISGVTNGVVTFAYAANTNNLATNRTGHITLLGQSISVIQAMPTYSLGTTNLLEGPSAGSDSVVLAVNYPWTASSNATWLHLSAGNQSGGTSTNVVFTFDANPGTTRTGMLTIGGQTLTITQAGVSYAVATSQVTLASSASGLASPFGAAVDPAGNVYISDLGNHQLFKWSLASNSVSLVTAFVGPCGLIFDRSTNLYIAGAGGFGGDPVNSLIKKLTASGVLSTVVGSGLNSPRDVAVDSAGNVYIADDLNNVIKKWSVTDGTVTTLISSGAGDCRGVAVDVAGNVYFTDRSNNAIKEWLAANGNVITLVSSGLNGPSNIRVDGSGNIYLTDSRNDAVKKWTAVNSNVTTVASTGLSNPTGLGLDPAGNIYIADANHSAVKEQMSAWVDVTAKIETSSSGNDTLPVVLPVSVNLLAPFAPTSDAAWLTINGATNGVVSFARTANTQAFNRTGHITVLGQSITVTQYGVGQLGATNLLEAADAGSDSVLLVGEFPWTATANNSWLHLSAANQSGASSTNIIFSFDANAGATRTGTLTIAGYTVTVTQAGSSYVLANPVVPLIPYMTNNPQGTTVDGAGNVYYADFSYRIKKWTAANNTVTTLISSGLNGPLGLVTDGSGNLYIADSGNNAVKKWTATNSTVTTLVSSGLNDPFAVAVDSSGNVYIADTGNNAIKKWTAANSNVTALVSSGLINPQGVAVDIVGDVYIADNGNGAVKKWSAANSNVTTVVSSGAGLLPKSVTVDGGGNLYINDDFQSMIVKWTLASNSLSTLFPGDGALLAVNLSVDNAGNMYFGNFGFANEQLRAFVDPTAKSVTTNSGSGSLPAALPVTANLTGPFLPTSDAAWLTISGVNNGVVSYAYSANSGPVRTAHITLLGQSITLTQDGAVAVVAPRLNTPQLSTNNAIAFSFTNVTGAAFTVWASTNVALPLTNWTILGAPATNASGIYQFSDTQATNYQQRFYRVTSP